MTNTGIWTVVHVDGDVDFAAAPRLRERLVAAIDAAGPYLVVDLTRAGMVDSTALGVLAGMLRRVAVRGGELRVVAVGAARDLFGMTGLDRVFRLYAAAAEATSDPPYPRRVR